MATFYYNGAVDNDWNNLLNWWDDDSFSIQSTVLPSVSDNVLLYNSVTSNGGSEPTVNNITFNDPGYYNSYYISINITCSSITFNATTYLSGSTITGNATFNEDSYNAGTITGNATFNGSSYNYPGTVTGTATYNSSYNGPDPTFTVYIINGQSTTLDVNTGNGYWNSIYYIGGIATTLDSSGNGCWSGTCYESGSSLGLSCPPCTGYAFNGYYYINGVQTSLDSNGNGYWESTYYVGGVATTLDSNGDGTWNGTEYLGGIAAATLYYNNAADTDWNNLSNWWTNLACTNASAFLPRTIDSVVFVSRAACLSNGGSEPVIKNLTLN